MYSRKGCVIKTKCHAVDGRIFGAEISAFNDAYPDDFEALTSEHLERGQWFAIEKPPSKIWIAFAGSVPFLPFPDVLYFKRVAVVPEYRGYGLQCKLMDAAEKAAGRAGYRLMVSTTDVVNVHSANNFIKRGWRLVNPEKPWEPTSLYWVKEL
jgi:ribosomal protein S18 acetylase RimI-like enzyme